MEKSIINFILEMRDCLNCYRNVYMFFFFKSTNRDPDREVTVVGRRLSVVHEYKYLCIIHDIQLEFKKQVLLLVKDRSCQRKLPIAGMGNVVPGVPLQP